MFSVGFETFFGGYTYHQRFPMWRTYQDQIYTSHQQFSYPSSKSQKDFPAHPPSPPEWYLQHEQLIEIHHQSSIHVCMLYSPSYAPEIWPGSESVRKMIRKLGRWKRWIRLYVHGGGVCGSVKGVEGSFPTFAENVGFKKRPALDS
jgi:hypothetical protein